jgi:hypothetical protein
MLCDKKYISQYIKFDNIALALSKMDDIKFISSSTEPYIILIEYRNEPIQFIYDYYSGKLVICFNFNYVKIKDLTYELFEQKGIRYYLNLLIDLKVKEHRNYVEEIKIIMKNENIEVDTYNEDMSIVFKYPQTEIYITKYNNHIYDSDIRFMIDHHFLRWKINFYSHSKEWDFINMIDIREKGVSYFLDSLRGSKKY